MASILPLLKCQITDKIALENIKSAAGVQCSLLPLLVWRLGHIQ